MVSKIFERVTFQQATVIRGLLVSLFLIFLESKDFVVNTFLLYLYLVLFVIRVLFNYNLEGYNYKLVPSFSVVQDDDDFFKPNLTGTVMYLDSHYYNGAEKGTWLYELKTSSFYFYTFYVSNLLSTLLCGLLIILSTFSIIIKLLGIIGLFDLLALLALYSLKWLTYGLIGLLIIFVIYTLSKAIRKEKSTGTDGKLKE